VKQVGTFISVGNAVQPFPRIFDIVESVADILPEPVLIQHGNTVYNNPRFECVDFIDMDTFSAMVEEAKVIIIHAGAGSVMHAIHAGKKPIVVPRLSENSEHIDNHQLEFASALAEEGKIYIASDATSLKNAVHYVMAEKSALDGQENKNILIEEVDRLFIELSETVDSEN